MKPVSRLLSAFFAFLFLSASFLPLIPTSTASAFGSGDMNLPSDIESTLQNSISAKFLGPYNVIIAGAPSLKLFSNPTYPNDITYASVLNGLYTLGDGCTWTNNQKISFNDGTQTRDLEINAVIKKGKYTGSSTLSDTLGVIGTGLKYGTVRATNGVSYIAEKVVGKAFSSDGENKCGLPAPDATDQELKDWISSDEYGQPHLTIRVKEGDDVIYLLERDSDGEQMAWRQLDGGKVSSKIFRGVGLSQYLFNNTSARDGLRLGYAFVSATSKQIVSTYDASITYDLCPGQRYFQQNNCTSGEKISSADWASFSDQDIIDALSGNGYYPAVLSSSTGDRNVQIAQLASETSQAYASGLISQPTDSTDLDGASCADEAGDFSFFLCPALKLASEGFEVMDNRIRRALEVKPEYYNNNDIKGVWARVRNVAYLVLIPILLVMVIGTALGFSFLDAYTVKRAMPRLIVAVIFMAVSYDVCRIMIDVTNAVGKGVGGLVAQPFGGQDNLTLAQIFNPSVGNEVVLGTGVILGGIVLFGIGALSIGILASYIGTTLLAMVIFFALLTIRELVIVFLIIASPVAILSWIFPGNDKIWKLWWGTFTKLLLVFPIVIALLILGRGFAKTVGSIPSEGTEAMFIVLVKMTAIVASILAGPWAIKAASGAFGNLAGIVNDRGKGLFDRNKQWRSKKRSQLFERAKAGNRYKGNNAISRRMSKAVQTGTIVGSGKLSKSKVDAERTSRFIEQMAKAKEDIHVKTVTGNDDLLNAAMAGDGTDASARAHLKSLGQSDAEIEQNIAMINAAKKAVGTETFNKVAAVANAATGTGYGNGPAEMYMAINRAAGSDRALAATMLAEARGNAERASRPDLAGAGFAISARQQQRLFENGEQDINSSLAADVNREITDNALLAKSAGYFAGGRNNALVNMIPAMQRRLQSSTARLEASQSDLATAQISGDPVAIATAQDNLARAHHSHKQTLAATAAFQDVAAQLSPENAETIGQQLLGQHAGPIVLQDGTNAVIRDGAGNILSTGTTFLDQIEYFRSDREFNQYRREYASQQGQAAAAAAAARSGAGPAGQPPITPTTTPTF